MRSVYINLVEHPVSVVLSSLIHILKPGITTTFAQKREISERHSSSASSHLFICVFNNHLLLFFYTSHGQHPNQKQKNDNEEKDP